MNVLGTKIKQGIPSFAREHRAALTVLLLLLVLRLMTLYSLGFT